LEKKNKQEETPLLTAVAHGNTESAQILIEKGANLKVTDCHDKNIVHWAAQNGAVSVLKVSA